MERVPQGVWGVLNTTSSVTSSMHCHINFDHIRIDTG